LFLFADYDKIRTFYIIKEEVIMVTSSDVARLAKVSPTTVCRAFRDDCYVHSDTRKKILAIADELGYFPNYSAKSLKDNKSRIIGLLLSDTNNIFFASLTENIEHLINERGYRLMLAFSNEDAKKERQQLQYFISLRVSGIIYMPVSRSNEDIIKKMKDFDINVLQFARDMYSFFDTYTVDDEEGAYMATSHLLKKGHRNIIITDYDINMRAPVKTMGYARAFKEAGIPLDERNIISLPYNMDASSLIAGAIVERNATAIVTSNNIMTLKALKACNQLKLSIPDDISFIAYDDSEWLEFLGITVIAHQMDRISIDITNALLSLIDSDSSKNMEEKKKPQKTWVKPYLLLRNSTKDILEK